MHFEVHNNGNSILYLDGVVFGSSPIYRGTIPTPCASSVALRTDSEGVYARQILAFPGSGSDYPLAPGQTRLVALAAIDHRSVHPTLLDLSDADFEVGRSAVADNPAVPNLRDIGLERFDPQSLFTSRRVDFLARAFDPSTLPVLHRDVNGAGYVRVPTDLLLDVVAFERLWPDRDVEFPPCVPMLPRVFDRFEGGFVNIGFNVNHAYSSVRGLQRRALRRTPDGRIILFNTNTSAVDFEHAVKTPGWVPEPER